MEKRLMRSQKNKVVGGVCAGIGEYFDVDPVFIRIITVILALVTNAYGIVAYFVAMIIMPKKEITAEEVSASDPAEVEQKTYSSWQRYLPGLVLIGIGVVILLQDRMFWFDWDQFWPVMLVLAGLFLIFRKKHTNDKKAEVKTDFAAQDSKPHAENGGTTV